MLQIAAGLLIEEQAKIRPDLRIRVLKLAYKGNDFIHTDVDGVRFGP